MIENPNFCGVMGLYLQLSNEKNPGCLGYIGGYTTSYMGIVTNQYKDPY